MFAILAERTLGPKLYGIFPEGRLEQYIPVLNTSKYAYKSHGEVCIVGMNKQSLMKFRSEKTVW